MVETEKILFSFQMAEESFQEVELLLKDGKIKSLLNSLYNVYYYGMEAVLFKLDIHCRNHQALKKAFVEKFLRNHTFNSDESAGISKWENEIETIVQIKNENEKGILPPDHEVQRLIQTGRLFLNNVKKNLQIESI